VRFTAVRGEIPKRIPKIVYMRVQILRHARGGCSMDGEELQRQREKTVRESVRERFMKMIKRSLGCGRFHQAQTKGIFRPTSDGPCPRADTACKSSYRTPFRTKGRKLKRAAADRA